MQTNQKIALQICFGLLASGLTAGGSGTLALFVMIMNHLHECQKLANCSQSYGSGDFSINKDHNSLGEVNCQASTVYQDCTNVPIPNLSRNVAITSISVGSLCVLLLMAHTLNQIMKACRSNVLTARNARLFSSNTQYGSIDDHDMEKGIAQAKAVNITSSMQ